ncbi:flagellar filament capping protein FliD [Clostridium sp. CF012]|uniref:flagellar filament capping protein FliD n=1 Tax=Clostridium sp. CF012 TaxID=2843319 RepID=UPI001C0AF62B|nr:flagellar filament capping protein FliD [Clostridium sp. CF012]MBU3142343.1 flagellar filament capping protein FliD [Clostridium sp. CF012]
MSKIRFTGMATGLDTDALIKQMMQPYRMRVDKQKQDKQVMQWKQDMYRDIITDIRGLKNSYLDSVKPDDNLLMQKNYTACEITSTDPTKTTATANVGAVSGNYTVNVTKLAAGAKSESTATLGDTVTNSTILSTLGVTAGTLTVNGTVIPVDNSMTIQQFTNKINSSTNGTVIARFSELTHSFSFETKKQGTTATLEISDTAGLLTALNINGAKKQGNNAVLSITPPGGVAIAVTTKETNDFAIDGINYSLKAIGATTLSVTANTDKTYDKILGFITKYNELIDKVNGKIDARKNYSYTPLTDDQKTSMKPEEIKAWEDKAKEGLIKGDSSLSDMLTSMRRAFFEPVGVGAIGLKDLGFTTSKETTLRGKIIIDPTLTAEQAKNKFSEALKSNGTQVVDLLSKSSTDYKEKGIFQRLDDIVQDYTNPFGGKAILLKKAGIKGNTTESDNILSKQMKEKDKYISELNRKFEERETNYYTRFSKLEKAMTQLNSQSSWLTKQLGGGQ